VAEGKKVVIHGSPVVRVVIMKRMGNTGRTTGLTSNRRDRREVRPVTQKEAGEIGAMEKKRV